MKDRALARFALAAASVLAVACEATRKSQEPAEPARDAHAAQSAQTSRQAAEAAPRASAAKAIDAPAADPALAPDEGLRKLLGTMGVRWSSAERKLEVSGWVNMQTGLVEVFACAPQGKTHESVVVLDCVPSGLHAGLLALGARSGTPVEMGTDGKYTQPTGDRIEVFVRWTDAQGAEHVARAEDWIWNETEKRAMQPSSWIFAGSFVQPSSDPSARATFAADYIKSLVTTYHDATSILENPYPEGDDDTVYYANEKAVPPVGTPITAIFQRAK